MAQGLDTTPTNRLVTSIVDMVEEFLVEALGSRYEPISFQKKVLNRLETFLDGSYTTPDVAGLIAHDITRLVYRLGDIVTYFPAIARLETAICRHLQSDI